MKFERDNMREILAEKARKGVTPQRLAAAKRALKRQRDKLPLFADQIAATQPTPEERIRFYDEGRILWMRSDRQWKAERWKRARKKIRAMDESDRFNFLKYWNNQWAGPHRPEYCLDLLQHWDRETNEAVKK